MKIGADRAPGDAVDFAIEVSTGMEVSRDGIRRQARVIGVADRVIAPERRRRVEILVHPAKQVDIGAVACSAEPATRRRKRGDGRPCVGPGGVLISVCDSVVVNDAAEAINIAAN